MPVKNFTGRSSECYVSNTYKAQMGCANYKILICISVYTGKCYYWPYNLDCEINLKHVNALELSKKTKAGNLLIVNVWVWVKPCKLSSFHAMKRLYLRHNNRDSSLLNKQCCVTVTSQPLVWSVFGVQSENAVCSRFGSEKSPLLLALWKFVFAFFNVILLTRDPSYNPAEVQLIVSIA